MVCMVVGEAGAVWIVTSATLEDDAVLDETVSLDASVDELVVGEAGVV